MDDDNWDLNAVVRGCRSSVATRDPFSSFPPPLQKAEEVEEEGGDKGGSFLCFPDPFEHQPAGLLELEELCKPFFSKVLQQQQSSMSAVAVGLPLQQSPPTAWQTHRNISQIPRSKRRKNQQKKVICHVPADGLLSDMWAWRKYGQKPIKGSPYPRGYYRCSSSKSCLARKQVERSRADPGMFIITYTEEHNHPMPTHRNSLAGSTRHKFPAPHSSPAGGEGGDDQPPSNHSSSSPPSTSTAAGFSPTTPLTSSIEDELLLRRESSKGDQEDGEDEALDEEEEDDEQGMLLVEDMEVIGEDDLFFIGSEDILGSTICSIAAPTAAVLFDEGDGLGDRFIASTRWLSNSNNNTAAAAGGS